MPETVLAGQNGAPAIDAMTGMPLTMEELLRRRGILAHKGVVSPLNQQTTPVVDPSAAASALAANASAPNGTVLQPNGVGTGRLGDEGVPIEASTPLITSPNPSDDPGSDLWPYILGAGGAAAAIYGARKLRNRPGMAATAATMSGERPRVNPNLFREPDIIDAEFSELNRGSNRTLDPLIDPKNVAHAGEIGAGPKRLSGPEPVANDNSVRDEIARRNIPKGQLQDYNTRAPVSTRMENAARQSNNSRFQPPGTDPIRLADNYTDMSETEMGVARQIASRLRTDRKLGETRVPGRRTSGSGVAPAPVYDQGSELAEAVAIVRRLRNSPPVNTQKLLPLIRRLR